MYCMFVCMCVYVLCALFFDMILFNNDIIHLNFRSRAPLCFTFSVRTSETIKLIMWRTSLKLKDPFQYTHSSQVINAIFRSFVWNLLSGLSYSNVFNYLDIFQVFKFMVWQSMGAWVRGHVNGGRKQEAPEKYCQWDRENAIFRESRWESFSLESFLDVF